MKNKILEFAESEGYEDVEKLKFKYKDYECYEPITSKGEDTFTGMPLVILVKGNEIRMSSYDETLEIIDLADED